MDPDPVPDLEAWEGVHPVPDAHPPCCSWCRLPDEAYQVVLFRLNLPACTRDVQAELVCSRCALTAAEYIRMRKSGLSRKATLRDFGFRG
jgi:hypothetical protein